MPAQATDKFKPHNVYYSSEERATISGLKAKLTDPAITPNDAYKVTLTLTNLKKAAEERAKLRWERRKEWREQQAAAGVPVIAPTRGKSRRSPEEDERVAAFMAFCGEGAIA